MTRIMGFVVANGKSNPLLASRKRILALATLGLIFLGIPVAMKIMDPVLMIAKYKTRVAPGSTVHELLKKELEAVHVSAYLFNVTNSERFLAGEDQKLKVEEVGPFTYRELRSNENLEIDLDAEVVRYSPKINPLFSPEESIADPRKVNVTLPNIAMLTMLSMMSTHPFLTRMGFSMLTKQLGTKPFVSMSAHDYLWGYNETLITVGNTFMPGWIHFETMGLMDRMYDKKVSYRLEVGATNSDKFMIKRLNGCSGLSVWDYDDPNKRTSCNTFTNAYEGIAYPTDLTSATPIRIFRNVLCRMLELDFHETRTMEFGPQALVYKISNRTWSGLEKECTCSKGTCIDGVYDISPCFYQLPLAMSNAHFLNGGPHLFERIEGLQPDEEKHGSEFLIEPKIGAVLTTHFSVQVNIVIKDIQYHSDKLKRLSNMVLPVGYFKIAQPELPEENKAEMRMLYVTGPYIALGLQIFFSLIGILLLAFTIRLMYWNWICLEGRGIAFSSTLDDKPMHPVDSEVPLMIVRS